MCSLVCRLLRALQCRFTRLFEGSVHLYVTWETVRRPYVSVPMLPPQTVAHFCTWQRKRLCFWRRASAGSLVWLCGVLNRKKLNTADQNVAWHSSEGLWQQQGLFKAIDSPQHTNVHTCVWCRSSEKWPCGSYDSGAERRIKGLKQTAALCDALDCI